MQTSTLPDRLLVLSSFRIWPPHFGSSERTYNLIQQLAELRRFELRVLYSTYAQVRGAVQAEGSWPHTQFMGVGPARRWAQAFNPRLLLRGLALIRRERPRIILCEHLWSTMIGMLLSLLAGVPFILDDHNAEYVRFQRMGKKTAPFIKIWEWLACKRAALITCVSEVDKQHLVELGISPHKIAIVVNAIDTQQYRDNSDARDAVRASLEVAEKQPLFLFFGKLDYRPNAEAVEVLVREIMPRILRERPKSLFVVCGYHPNGKLDLQHPQLRFVGFVPRIEDYISAADVIVVPLLSGGGTKFKIIQSLACYRPVVTTAIGAEGIEPVGAWLRVADDWDEFGRQALRCLDTPSQLPAEPIVTFRHLHSWEYAAAQLLVAIEEVLERDKDNRG
jgi:glycosyltransferase involved in cell wall biosynthesis